MVTRRQLRLRPKTDCDDWPGNRQREHTDAGRDICPHADGCECERDVTGPAVDTPYGPVQVEAKISGGRIVDVVALELPNDRRRSQQISQYVEPILHDEALQAQSAQIDGISGATYTSEAYMQSLQGALDRLHG